METVPYVMNSFTTNANVENFDLRLLYHLLSAFIRSDDQNYRNALI